MAARRPRQVAACLGLPVEQVRLTLGGVGGAFGAREDVSLQIHACLLALRTGRPVKMVYSREESFFGHVHRHPARIWMRHTPSADGTMCQGRGAHPPRRRRVPRRRAATSSPTRRASPAGPYNVPNAVVEGIGVRTNNPPCGAMRGFGAVQGCFAHEAQMDKLAAACGVDPIELRLQNALGPGDTLLTGQVVDGTLPVAEVIRAAADAAARRRRGRRLTSPVPAAPGRTADAADVQRGVGFAVGFKNLMFSEGFDDDSHARVRVAEGVVTMHCAAAEVGQGFVTLCQQIARRFFGVDEVVLAAADTSIGSAGIDLGQPSDVDVGRSGREGVPRGARRRGHEHRGDAVGVDAASLSLVEDRIVSADGAVDIAMRDAVVGGVFESTYEYHHDPTQPLDDGRPGERGRLVPVLVARPT